ncbi:ABC-2 family transporter protein [Lysinibacillus sp. AC-3]|nr:ABC-2 family transporter protein [Lysinibacillus sp. AC-3]
MLNLIRRDVILQKKHLLVFIPFILVFVIFDTSPVLVFLVASIFIPFNTYGYDEKAETDILLNSLPYTRKEIISHHVI